VVLRAGLDVLARKKFLPCRESNLGRPTHSLVTALIELPRLLRIKGTAETWAIIKQ